MKKHLTEAQIEQRRNAGKAYAKKYGRDGMSKLGKLGYQALVNRFGPTKAIHTLAHMMRLKKATQPEQWLYDILNSRGVSFDSQFVIADRYIVDAGDMFRKWIIEVDDGWRERDGAFGVSGKRMAQLEKKLRDLRNWGYSVLHINYTDPDAELQVIKFLDQL
jgi:hypothetical protein